MLTEAPQREIPEWLRELYPFRTRKLQLGAYQMSFVDEGPHDAPAFVLLHGNPTWSFLYRDLIQQLRPQYRVIAPDHIGFGLSDKPAMSVYHTLAQHIENFAALVEALELHRFTLVAHGWGGPIGLGYAVTTPQKVSRLVLTNTWAFNLPQARRPRLPLGIKIANAGRVGALLDSWLNLSLQSTFASRMYRSMSDMAMEGYTYPFHRSLSRVGPRAFTQMFLHPDANTVAQLEEIRVGLKNITAPASMLWGARDPVLSKLPAYLLRDELKGAAEPVFLPDVSHYVPEEAPDALAEIVLRQVTSAPQNRPDDLFKIL